MKKALSILLSAVILLSLFTIVPLSAGAATEDEWEYEVLEDGTAKTTHYNGPEGNSLTIPPYLGGHEVSMIGMNTFYRYWSFLNFDTVVIPNTVKTIAGGAFDGIDFKHITIPNSVTFIGTAFEGKSIEEISIPNSVTTVMDSAFHACKKLKTVKLSTSCKEVAWGMFQDCTALQTITIPSNVELIRSSAFYGCTDLKSVVISTPKTALEIGPHAFRNCVSLKSINLPEGLTYIDNNAFSGCTKLGSITLPDTLTACAYSVFEDCTALKTVKLSASMKEIPTAFFKGCTALTSVTFPACVETVDSEAFMGCTSLTAATFQGSEMWMTGGRAFMGCTSLSKVTLPNKMYYLGDSFVNCPALTSVRFPDTVDTEVDEHAFGYLYNEETEAYTRIPGFVVYGHKDTVGEQYAKDNDFIFVNMLDTPQITKLENTTAGVKLTWGKITDAQKYRIFIKNGTSWKKLADATANSYVYKAAKSGTKYTFTVRCITADGKYFNSEYNKTGKSITFIAAPKITKLENTAKGTKITWGKVAGAAKYRVFVKNGSSWKKLADTAATSYVNTKIKSGVYYTYTVRCVAKDGKSFTSAYDTAGKKVQYIATPAAPTLKNTKSGVQISWKKITGAQKYRVFRKTGSGGWKKLADTTAVKYVDKTAKNGATYAYTIRCISKDAKSYTSAYNTAGKTIKCKR